VNGKKLRAGLIGLGMMGRHHARVLGSLDGVELVAVADPGGDAHGVANGRPVELPDHGNVIEIPQVGGLHHQYLRRAA